MKDILHVIGLRFPHDDVVITGNRAALEKLQKALNKVLSSAEKAPEAEISTFAADGEGYSVIVEVLTTEDMKNEAVPYTEMP